MEVVAKTNGGVLISATDSEIKEILRSVTGQEPKELSIGQKVPAIDYASSITKLKNLKSDYQVEGLVLQVKYFNDSMNSLLSAINSAASVEV